MATSESRRDYRFPVLPYPESKSTFEKELHYFVIVNLKGQ